MRLRVPHSEPRRDAIANVRAAVRLCDEGLTYREIGERLGCTQVNAHRLIARWGDWVRVRRITAIAAE
jgi:hypothetical protein